jgi:hypothetical protein
VPADSEPDAHVPGELTSDGRAPADHGPFRRPDAPSGRLFRRRLALAGSVYLLFHHVGSLPDGLGRVGVTRWADWLDLGTPFAVLGTVAAALLAGPATRKEWTTFGLGATLYAQGQGIHLAANSIGNARHSAAAHLWDEMVGHLTWYLGAAVVLAALAGGMARRPGPVPPTGMLLAVGIGVTWATNALGGGTSWFSLPVAVALSLFGWRRRDTLAAALPVAFVPAAALLIVAALVSGQWATAVASRAPAPGALTAAASR